MRLRRVLVRSETFVEVKSYNLSPFNPFAFDQMIEKSALGRRRSEEANGEASHGDKAAHLRSDLDGRGLESLLAGRTDMHV